MRSQTYWVFVIPFLFIGVFTYDWYMTQKGGVGIVDQLLSGEGFIKLNEWRMNNMRLPNEPINLSLQGKFKRYQRIIKENDKTGSTLMDKNKDILNRLLEINETIESQLTEYTQQSFEDSSGQLSPDQISASLENLIEFTNLLGDEYRLMHYYSDKMQKDLSSIHAEFEKKLKELIHQESEITEGQLAALVLLYRELESKQDKILKSFVTHQERFKMRQDSVGPKIEETVKALDGIPGLDVVGVYKPYHHQDIRGLTYLENIKINEDKVLDLIATRRLAHRGFIDRISEDINANVKLLTDSRKDQEQQTRQLRQKERSMPVYETKRLRETERQRHRDVQRKMQREREAIRDRGFYD